MNEIPNFNAVKCYVDHFLIVPDGFDGIKGVDCYILRSSVYQELLNHDHRQKFRELKIFNLKK